MQETNNTAALRVSELWMYPVKSLGGIAVPQAKVLAKGFEYDRRWMLIDERNQFITQRVLHQLALFKLSFHQHGFMLHHAGHEMLLPLHEHTSEPITATIWDDAVEVLEVSAAHSAWFSAQVGLSCKLVYFPEAHTRKVDDTYALNSDKQRALLSESRYG